MFKLFALVPLLVATLTLAATARATAPERSTFTFSGSYTDMDTCGFPIDVHVDFTNMAVDSSLATGTGTLQLHQRDVETWTANGVTLNVKGDYTIFVAIVNGIPQTAKHVGLLDFILGPDGDHLFLRTGEAVYQVVEDPPGSGQYFDGPLLARHGVRENFDAAKICAAFS